MRFLVFWIGVLGGVAPVIATVGSDATEPQPQEQPQETIREAVVVTASMSEREIDRIPASVEVIDTEEIDARQSTSVADLLATIPGMTIARSGSPGQSASLFTRGTESDHTLVLWNGIELNNPYFGGFNWAFQPTEGLDRVEVVRGPFSALHGSDAVGGVVQMISSSSDRLGLVVEGGENGYARTALDLGLVGETVSFHLAGHLRRGDGELENDFYDGDELVARVDGELADGVHLGLVARWNDSETGIPLSGGLPSPERRIAWEETEVAIPFRFDRGRWNVDALVSTVAYDSRFSDPLDGFGFTASQTESRSIRARVAATRRFGAAELSFGAETESLEVDDRSVFGINLVGADQRTDALFAEWHVERGGWILDLGARFDDNDAYGSQTSPRIALSRAVGSATRVFASYGESFRAPSVGELFFPFSGNPDLEPETGESVELGFAWEAGPWSGRVALFENDLDQLIDFDFVTFRNVNVGQARTRGAEVSFAYRERAWSVRWNGTFLDAENLDTGSDLLRRPETQASVVARWAPERWVVSAVGRYVGERDDVDPVAFARTSNRSYAVADLGARFRWSERVAPYVRLENAFDREYAEVLGFPSPGRTWVGGVSLSY